ncbi:MAG: Glutathione S-transferase domain protein [Betaproteobacteria bacterium]|nr:Glutathione S-transferase domain protein [Betaproteobacteria bacterium]
MKLFFNNASPFVRKVRVFARETGLDKNIEETTTAVSPVQDNASLGQANPLQKIPALLLDDGSALFDSPVICEYLDSLHAGRKLFPAAGPARWTALKLQATGDGILDAGVLCRYEMAFRPKEFQWSGWLDGQKKKWHGGLDYLEREAGALDGEPTIGGITVACALGWLDFRYGDDNWRNGRPKLAAWFEKFAARPSMKATMPSA